MGLSHAENITVQAEAYDVALDMSFPKGKNQICHRCSFCFRFLCLYTEVDQHGGTLYTCSLPSSEHF